MEKRFDVSKNFLFTLIFLGFPIALAIILMIVLIQGQQSSNLDELSQVGLIAILGLDIFLIWRGWSILNNAIYIIKGNDLIYKFGLNKGKINIGEIKSISNSNYPSAGNRPTLAFSGFKIKYGAGYSIFVSPKNSQEFLLTMTEINHRIKINK